MKIINQTIWNTAHLRAILQHAAEVELEPKKRKDLIVTVCYTRGGHSSGCAFIGGRHATIRIRHPFSRAARYLQVDHDDPRTAVSIWSNADDSGKVVKDTTPQPLDAAEHAELLLHFASVAVHEFAHIRGMHHLTMPSYYKWHGDWRPYVQWAIGFPLAVQVAKGRTTPTVEDKLAHATQMLKAAETRAKRATTLVKKWKTKTRYYERAMAARGTK